MNFFAFLTCTAMMMVYHCKADGPPPPTGLTYVWLDAFTVNVSWQKPVGVEDGEVQYRVYLVNNTNVGNRKKQLAACYKGRNFTETLFTEESNSDNWMFNVWTVGHHENCNSANVSTTVSITIKTQRPRAKVEDVRCLLYSKTINCSWIRGSRPVNLSYGICGHGEQHLNGLKVCHEPYSRAMRDGCLLDYDNIIHEMCVAVNTGAGLSTFKAAREVHPPKLSITEEGDNLLLSWIPPKFGTNCNWKYEVCHTKCNGPKECFNYTTGNSLPYDRRCRYEFRSRVYTDNCDDIFSDFGDVVPYGTNEPPDETLTVVAIVVPIILSVCIILSCYCFRRHSNIICPIIPDPSVIFKDMMMNRNKEHKITTGSLYTPVPEPIIEITVLTETSAPQQNS